MKQYLTIKEFNSFVRKEIKLYGNPAKAAAKLKINRITLVTALRRKQFSRELAKKFGYEKKEVYFQRVNGR